MMRAAHDAVEAFYDHYANTHSILHFSVSEFIDQDIKVKQRF